MENLLQRIKKLTWFNWLCNLLLAFGLTWGFLKPTHFSLYYLFLALIPLCLITLSQVHTQMICEPGPFRFVLRLADEDCGNAEDEQTIDFLLTRFKAITLPNADCKYEGFDIGRGFVWFHFSGRDLATVQHAISPLINDCKIRKGSYFEGKVRDYLVAT